MIAAHSEQTECVHVKHHVLADLEIVVCSNLSNLLITLLFMRASLLLAAS